MSFGLRLQKKVIDEYILLCIKMKLSSLNSRWARLRYST